MLRKNDYALPSITNSNGVVGVNEHIYESIISD